jgi:hypothetical protein
MGATMTDRGRPDLRPVTVSTTKFPTPSRERIRVTHMTALVAIVT